MRVLNTIPRLCVCVCCIFTGVLVPGCARPVVSLVEVIEPADSIRDDGLIGQWDIVKTDGETDPLSMRLDIVSSEEGGYICHTTVEDWSEKGQDPIEWDLQISLFDVDGWTFADVSLILDEKKDAAQVFTMISWAQPIHRIMRVRLEGDRMRLRQAIEDTDEEKRAHGDSSRALRDVSYLGTDISVAIGDTESDTLATIQTLKSQGKYDIPDDEDEILTFNRVKTNP
ncbi:MAG: hypothetical protein H6815_11695 [Phycisphaeraceae bacterium]|nr:hypothetical protein [Phycisphaerales bacterium]MCB9861102.1 hypothetical protein [Phycisphaeraceae bacterium]